MAIIVMTSGSFDLFHIGHARYLESAASYGTLLIVAVETDELVRMRKGPGRPVIPQAERLEMVRYHRSVSDVVLKKPGENIAEKYSPDLIIVSDDRPRPKIPNVNVIVLPRMAQTSTSNIVRNIEIHRREDATRYEKNSDLAP